MFCTFITSREKKHRLYTLSLGASIYMKIIQAHELKSYYRTP